MVNGVNGNRNSLSVLLEQKQKKLESINKQKQAVQNELTNINSAAVNAKVNVGEKEVSLSDAIVALQNHPFKGMKVPDSNAPEYQIKNADKENLGVYNEAQFEKDMAEFKKAEAEYKALEKNVETATKELEISKEDLTKIMAEAEKVEQKLADENADYEVTMGDIEDLNKKIDEATIDVTLTKDKNNNTLVEATVNKLKDLQAEGLVDKSIDLKNLQPAQLKKLSEAVVNTDIEKGNVAKGTALDGTSEDYTNMEEGAGRTYTVAQMQEMAKALGADAENDEAGFAITVDDLKDLKAPKGDFVENHAGDNPPVQNQKTKIANGEIVLPRGIKWQGTEGNKLSDFGIKDNGDGTYTASTGKTYTASEVNKWFREVEDSSGNNYSKYLDKAEKLGIDYNQFSSSKELKEAVKAAEKQAKAEKKAKEQASVVADLKASIKVEGQKAEDATKKGQSAENAETEQTETEAKKNAKAKAKQLESLSENERKRYYEIMADTDVLTGGQLWADNYLTRISAYQEGRNFTFTYSNGKQSYTVRLTNKGEKVFEKNGVFYEIGKDGFPDESKTVKKEDIKSLS